MAIVLQLVRRAIRQIIFYKAPACCITSTSKAYLLCTNGSASAANSNIIDGIRNSALSVFIRHQFCICPIQKGRFWHTRHIPDSQFRCHRTICMAWATFSWPYFSVTNEALHRVRHHQSISISEQWRSGFRKRSNSKSYWMVDFVIKYVTADLLPITFRPMETPMFRPPAIKSCNREVSGNHRLVTGIITKNKPFFFPGLKGSPQNFFAIKVSPAFPDNPLQSPLI